MLEVSFKFRVFVPTRSRRIDLLFIQCRRQEETNLILPFLEEKRSSVFCWERTFVEVTFDLYPQVSAC